ncbi:protein YnaN [Escherichia coli]
MLRNRARRLDYKIMRL